MSEGRRREANRRTDGEIGQSEKTEREAEREVRGKQMPCADGADTLSIQTSGSDCVWMSFAIVFTIMSIPTAF
jgi:hypothetical protein